VGNDIAYHGYATLVKQFIYQQVPKDRPPTLLEVGIDRGVMLIPMVVFLARTRLAFVAIGVDIMVQEQVKLMLQNIDLLPQQQAYCIEGNSLEVLPKMVDQGMKFDVLLLDGDHNYHTVSQELQHLEALAQPGAIVICDDYSGRWGDRDMFYADRPGYEGIKIATPKVETEKRGVKPAIDEWLEEHPTWQKSQPIPGEPVLLMRKAA
jgi:predicted O-methyltransferase YrrM